MVRGRLTWNENVGMEPWPRLTLAVRPRASLSTSLYADYFLIILPINLEGDINVLILQSYFIGLLAGLNEAEHIREVSAQGNFCVYSIYLKCSRLGLDEACPLSLSHFILKTVPFTDE